MRHEINLQFDGPYHALAEGVRQAAEMVLQDQHAPSGTVSIVLTEAETLRKANKRYAGIDEVTDVLSFTDGESMPDAEGVYFGDILIAVPVAESQAKGRGHTLQAEIVLLTVHGLLHLLGHDHAEPAGKAEMWARQAAILGLLEIDPSIMEPHP